MAQYNTFQFSENYTPLNHDQYVANVISGIELQGVDSGTQRIIQEMLYKSAHATGDPIMTYTRGWLSELTNHINGTFGTMASLVNQTVLNLKHIKDELNKAVTLLEATIDRQDKQDEEIKQLRSQFNSLSGNGGTTGSRNPKVAQPPNFRGSEDKLSLEEWKNLVSLWNKSQNINNDSQKIVNALSLLQGPAQKLMKSYYDKNAKDQDLGKIDDFWATLDSVYGHRNTVEGARKDLEALFKNKDLAKKDFIQYAEKFQVLADASEGEFMDKHLIEKLYDVADREVQLLMIGKGRANWPTTWNEFLKLILEFYKEVNPEKATSHIFGRSGAAKDPNAMDLDSAQSKKSKNKQANSQEARKKVSEPCAICNQLGKTSRAKTHETKDCYTLTPKENKPSTSSTAKAGQTSGNNNNGNSYKAKNPQLQNKIKQLKARQAEIEQELAQLDTDNNSSGTSPAGVVDISFASITEIEDDESSMPEPRNSMTGDEQSTSARIASLRARLERSRVDFPEGL
ncbi:hypothetical protein PsYK624_153810 [Phanerochaete sordida]|uniref:Retrotransposon gag domain-containing protein n=1 Tax=Phanerochaete sordida TaxID=48140 RepID=A0A9P3GRQ3_9APHY|nr:hypothetical protein PsYK624_153810 [Phanerochaete sordida]